MGLMNLIHNSIEAIKQNGDININWHKNSNNMSLLKIEDSGCGISKELRKRIFKPFFTTKINGSGLGLFTIYKIIYLSGGEINLSNSQKTTFLINLPLGDIS